MHRPRLHYWSCSKFADWVRGDKKPLALTHEDWEVWRETQEKENSIRFYISDTLLDGVQNFLYFPSDLFWNIKCYIRNRYIDKIHYIKTGLKPGQYYDLDYRILHGLFNELVDFVETDLGLKNQYLSESSPRRVKSRSAEDGVEYLQWASALKFDEDYGVPKEDEYYGKPTPQALSAIETLELYNWWKNYPNRPDPMDTSGWSKICDQNSDEVDKVEKQKAFDKLQEIEDQQETEETEMLIRLIKVRKSLWT